MNAIVGGQMGGLSVRPPLVTFSKNYESEVIRTRPPVRHSGDWLGCRSEGQVLGITSMQDVLQTQPRSRARVSASPFGSRCRSLVLFDSEEPDDQLRGSHVRRASAHNRFDGEASTLLRLRLLLSRRLTLAFAPHSTITLRPLGRSAARFRGYGVVRNR
jgi:hypothetical protein